MAGNCGGTRKIDGELPAYEIFQQFSGKVVAKGQLAEIGKDKSSGDYVYRIDFSKERQFVDDLRIISFTEFTIFETMTHDAFYTILANGGKWNGKDPFVKKEK